MIVGVLVSAFGTFWAGEEMHLAWPGGDWAAIFLALEYLIAAAFGLLLVRRIAERQAVTSS